MHSLDRREFLLSGVAMAGAATVNGRRVWIDPRQADMPNRPWRKIHLDFHNSRHIKAIGERLPADIEVAAINDLLYVHLKSKQFDAALAELDQILRLHPNAANARYLRGQVLVRMGREKEGRAELVEATKLLNQPSANVPRSSRRDGCR